MFTPSITNMTGSGLWPSFDGMSGGLPSFETAPVINAVDHPLRPVCTQWLEKIKLGWQFKQANFGKDAAEAKKFFKGPYDFMYNRKYANESADFTMSADNEFPAPAFRMTHNKVAEMVQLFGPMLYHQNPDRKVSPRKAPELPQMPPLNPVIMQQQMAQQQMQMAKEFSDQTACELIRWMLNYTPNELGLAHEMRYAIDEALVTGMSCLWCELVQPIGSNVRLPGNFWDSVDNVVLDPDAEDLRHCKWIARRCVHPVWEVERMWGLQPGTLRANLESFNQQAEMNVSPDGDWFRKKGQTNDLFCYWKLYSKMGMGGRLQGVPEQMRNPLDQFGDYVFLVVADNTPFPLNVPSQMANQAGAIPQIQEAVKWPTPYWLNDTAYGGWPMTPVAFHKIARELYPMSHLKPAMGELKFLNWVYSFIASKCQLQSRDFIAMKKSLGTEIKNAILHGKNYTLLEIEAGTPGTISELVQFLQHPESNGDIWKVIDRVNDNFEKRTGLSELLYGQSRRQMRSAEEASLKGDQLQIRPDDMAQRVEESATELSRKEALTMRWHLTGADIAPLMGEAAGAAWSQYVTTADVFVISHQLEYRIEAGSTKKPNRDRDASNMNQAMQTLFQPLLQFAIQNYQMGNVQPFETVNALVEDWCDANTLDKTKYKFILPPPPPPPMPAGPPGSAPPGAPAPGGPPPGGPPAMPAPTGPMPIGMGPPMGQQTAWSPQQMMFNPAMPGTMPATPGYGGMPLMPPALLAALGQLVPPMNLGTGGY